MRQVNEAEQKAILRLVRIQVEETCEAPLREIANLKHHMLGGPGDLADALERLKAPENYAGEAPFHFQVIGIPVHPRIFLYINSLREAAIEDKATIERLGAELVKRIGKAPKL